jgi:hypothetical protein
LATAAVLADACPSARIVLTYADAGTLGAEKLRGCRADAFVPKQDLATTDLSNLFGRSDS